MHKKSNEPVDTSHGYELSDLSIKQITIGVAGFFLFAAIAGVLGLAFLWLPWVDRARVPSDDTFQSRRIPAPPNPLLQNNVTADTDMWNLRGRENSILNSYGPSEHSKGAARIPIAEAIEREARLHDGGAATQPSGDPNAIPEEGGESTGASGPATGGPTDIGGIAPTTGTAGGGAGTEGG